MTYLEYVKLNDQHDYFAYHYHLSRVDSITSLVLLTSRQLAQLSGDVIFRTTSTFLCTNLYRHHMV
jgi:hypothetical protein